MTWGCLTASQGEEHSGGTRALSFHLSTTLIVRHEASRLRVIALITAGAAGGRIPPAAGSSGGCAGLAHAAFGLVTRCPQRRRSGGAAPPPLAPLLAPLGRCVLAALQNAQQQALQQSQGARAVVSCCAQVCSTGGEPAPQLMTLSSKAQLSAMQRRGVQWLSPGLPRTKKAADA